MKKEFKLEYNDNQYILTDASNQNKRFIIERGNLQFDTKDYYSNFFDDVNEMIDIKIINEIVSDDGEVYRIGNYIYTVMNEITGEICTKLNKECFSEVNSSK